MRRNANRLPTRRHASKLPILKRTRDRTRRRRDVNPGLATDNLKMVAASADQIRAVLLKDPGLLVELKRLMAKQATERGQIVAEQDLEDPVVLERLETDSEFRALATRLLQRYGYLTPQVNPLSPEGQQQDFLMKARAQEMAREETQPYYPTPDTRMAQSPQEYNSLCSSGPAAGALAGDLQLMPGDYANGCEAGPENVYGTPQQRNDYRYNNQAPYNNQLPSEQPLPERITPNPSPNLERQDLNSSQFLTASALSAAGGQGMMNPLSSSLLPGDMQEGGGMEMGAASLARQGSAGMGPLPYITGGIPVSPPELAETQTSRSYTLRRPSNAPLAREPVELVNAPSPYAFVPSLYDLYVQAAPRTGRLERFGLDAFSAFP